MNIESRQVNDEFKHEVETNKKDRSEKIVNFFIDSSLDEGANLRSVSEIYFNEPDNEIFDDYKDEYSYGCEFEEYRIGLDSEIKKELMSRLASPKISLEDKIKIARLVESLVNALEGEEHTESCFEYLNFLNEQADNSDTPIFLKLFFKTIIDRSNYNDFLLERPVPTTDKKEGVYTAGYERLHDSDLARLNFEFSSEVKKRIFRDSDEYYNDSLYSDWDLEKDDPRAINYWSADQKVYHGPLTGFGEDGQDFENEDNFTTVPKLCIKGDYFVSNLSSENIGVYSILGYLVAWKQKDKFVNSSVKQETQNEDIYKKIEQRKDLSVQERFKKYINESEDTSSLEVNSNLELFDELGFKNKDEFAIFKLMESLQMRQMINEELGVDIANFSLNIQYQFLKYLSKSENRDLPKFKKLILEVNSSNKNNRVISFLSLEHGGQEMGDKILSLAENLDQESAQAIFDKYTEIVDTADGVADYLRDNFGDDKNYDQNVINNITENLLLAGKDLLVNFADEAEKLEEQEELVRNVLEELKEVKINILMFKNAFKEVRPSLEEIQGVEFKKISWEFLNDKEKNEMYEIAKTNWLSRGEIGQKVLSDFEKVLFEKESGGGNDFYLYRKDGELVSFIRFDIYKKDFDDDRKHVHAHSFNVNPNMRGSKIGTAMALKMLRGEAEKGDVVHGSVYPDYEIGSKYIEDVGFNIVGVVDHNEKQNFEFEIVCDLEKNNNFKSKKISEDKNFKESTINGENVEEAVKFSPDLMVFSLDPVKQPDLIYKNTHLLLERGYVGTRYLLDKNNQGQRIYVFEKDKSILQNKNIKEAV